MNQKKLAILLALSLALTACNFPGSPSAEEQAAAVQTSAAETVNAQLTSNALLTPSPTETQPPTDTPEPSNTPEATEEPTTVPGSACDAMQFISDVTVPDGTDFGPGETFTKTWRLRNIGTCTWTTSYQLVFDSGDAMSGPASQALTGNVAPGQEVDISVVLTSPATAGNYVGNWKLRNASGVVFGLPGPFYVEIDVVDGGGGEGEGDDGEITLTPSQKGYVRSDGNVNPNPNAGDNSANQTLQAFLAFDISSIPAGATIESVRVDFSDYDTLGSPFNDLNCLRAYQVTGAFPLDSGDYFAGSPSGAIIRWCSGSELNLAFLDDDVKNALQDALGASTFELRLQFNSVPTNNDDGEDVVRFGDPTLTITYTEP